MFVEILSQVLSIMVSAAVFATLIMIMIQVMDWAETGGKNAESTFMMVGACATTSFFLSLFTYMVTAAVRFEQFGYLAAMIIVAEWLFHRLWKMNIKHLSRSG